MQHQGYANLSRCRRKRLLSPVQVLWVCSRFLFSKPMAAHILISLNLGKKGMHWLTNLGQELSSFHKIWLAQMRAIQLHLSVPAETRHLRCCKDRCSTMAAFA